MARARGILRPLVVATSLAMLMHAGPVFAQDMDGTLKKIKASGTLTIGYRESSPPFSFMGPDKRPAGYSIDLCLHVATAVQKSLGLADLKLSWVPVTPETRVEAVKRGSVDIECGSTTASLSRQEQVDFSLMTFVDGAVCSLPGSRTSAGSPISPAGAWPSPPAPPRSARSPSF